MISAIKSISNRIFDFGVSDLNSPGDNKRIRLVNRLSFYSIIGFVIWSISYAFDGIGITSTEALLPIIPYSIVLLINKSGRYEAARYAHYIFSILIFSYYGIAHGAKDGAEYYLLILCIVSLMYFDSLKTLIFLFLINFICFWIIKYTHSVMAPPVISGHALYIPNLINVFIFLFLVAYYFKYENKIQEDLLLKQNVSLGIEMQKSENLLLNILPADVADELKRTGENKPRNYEKATVIFTDFKNFTQITKSLSPEGLVHKVNNYFSGIDNIIAQYNVEKIKTIGDAYLCVAGIPVPFENSALEAVKLAIALQEFMKVKREEAIRSNEVFFELRIGIHTGPVVAGVVGKTKFAYDIWGDTVNTASRLETTCEIDRINISSTTYEEVKDYISCESRGQISAKHMGEIEMFYVLGEREKV